MKKYDLHIHSYFSPCSTISPETILKRAKEAGLDGIAITDHDTMKAYPILKKLNKDKNFEIIPGEEIRTNYGDVLALYIHKEIQSRDFLVALREIKAQGGIAIIPHPFTITHTFSFSYPFSKLKGKIDALETINSRNTRMMNNKGRAEALKLGFAQTGSSDSHLFIDIGKCYTMFDGDLRSALKAKKTIPGGQTIQGLPSLAVALTLQHTIRHLWKPESKYSDIKVNKWK